MICFSDGGRTEILDSGYHDSKRMSQMSSDSIESMMLHLIEDKPREAVITEVISIAQELDEKIAEQALQAENVPSQIEQKEEEEVKSPQEEETAMENPEEQVSQKADSNEAEAQKTEEDVASTAQELEQQNCELDEEKSGAQTPLSPPTGELINRRLANNA